MRWHSHKGGHESGSLQNCWLQACVCDQRSGPHCLHTCSQHPGLLGLGTLDLAAPPRLGTELHTISPSSSKRAPCLSFCFHILSGPSMSVSCRTLTFRESRNAFLYMSRSRPPSSSGFSPSGPKVHPQPFLLVSCL